VYTALSLKLQKHKINELTAQNKAVIKNASKTVVKNIHVTHIMLLNHVAVHRILCRKKYNNSLSFQHGGNKTQNQNIFPKKQLSMQSRHVPDNSTRTRRFPDRFLQNRSISL